MTTDFRALCVELTDCLEKADWPLRHRYVFRQWIDIARAALADEPAVPQGREPAAVTGQPSDEDLRDLWSWAAGQDQGPWPTQHHCFARAVLARWGNPAPTPPADGEVNDLSHLSNAEFNALCPHDGHAPGPEPLSPAAQAVLDAAIRAAESPDAEAIAAAALRAAADHVPDHQMSAHMLYAIADELENHQ